MKIFEKIKYTIFRWIYHPEFTPKIQYFYNYLLQIIFNEDKTYIESYEKELLKLFGIEEFEDVLQRVYCATYTIDMLNILFKGDEEFENFCS